MAVVAVGGTAFLKAAGTQYALKGNFKIQSVPVERTSVVGQDGIHGYTEKPVEQFIEADISDSGGLSLQGIMAATDVPVTAELLNGKIYICPGAVPTKVSELNTEEGSFTVRWVPGAPGTNIQEITNQ